MSKLAIRLSIYLEYKRLIISATKKVESPQTSKYICDLNCACAWIVNETRYKYIYEFIVQTETDQ